MRQLVSRCIANSFQRDHSFEIVQRSWAELQHILTYRGTLLLLSSISRHLWTLRTDIEERHEEK